MDFIYVSHHVLSFYICKIYNSQYAKKSVSINILSPICLDLLRFA